MVDKQSGPPLPGRLKSIPDAKMSRRRLDIADREFGVVAYKHGCTLG